MGTPRFVSPGAMAGNAIEEFFVKRAMEERQRMLDEASMQEQQARTVQQAQDLELRRQQEGRAAQAQQQQMTALEAEREFRRQATTEAAAARAQEAETTRLFRSDEAEKARLAAAERAADSNALRRDLAILAHGGKSETNALRNQLLQQQISEKEQKVSDAEAAKARTLESMKNYGDQALEVIGRLIDEEGNLKPNAAGVVGGIQGRIPPAFVISEGKQGALSDIDRLQSMLNIDTLMTLKQQSKTGATGFGALSERELAVIEAAASKLRNRKQGETGYAAELKRLRDAFRTNRGDVPSQETPEQRAKRLYDQLAGQK